MTGALLSRAASSDATTVDEEVTFCNPNQRLHPHCRGRGAIYNGRNGKFLFLSILEELENIIPDDDASLSAENAGGHVEDEWWMKSGVDDG